MKEHITSAKLNALSMGAASSPRRRSHLNTHDSLEADVQRLFIATEPATYMRPHRHSESHKWEFFVALEGSIDLLVFDANGVITERASMSRDGVRAVEIPPGTWHSYVCQASGTLALEVKQGGYIPTSNDDFAPWSPPENSSEAPAFLEWMRTAPVGRAPPSVMNRGPEREAQGRS